MSLKIDTLNKVFENCSDIQGIEKSKACICQLPANITLNRALRSMIEYPKYFIPEIITFLLIVVIVLNFGKIKKVMLRR